MSVFGLAERGRITVREDLDDSLADTAIFFAYDSNYQTPFKVMLLSMAQTGAMTRNPIIICSDDPAVFEDPIVKLVVDRPVLLEGNLRKSLYHLAEHSVHRPERAKWNKGTFLKWAAFDDYGFEYILFLDVDMLILKSLGGLATYRSGADLLTCPQFKPSLYRRKGGGKLPANTIARNLGWMISGDFDKVHHRRMNSGMMLLSRRTANPDFREEIIAFAANRTELHEQAHLTAFFAENPCWKVRLVPSTYNFQERYLGEVDPCRGLDVLSQIAILHYAGTKPWQSKLNPSARLSTLLWWNMMEAADKAGLLASPPASPEESGS
jgi:lipopolysaccharide biosynthesis glycosyltransferase